MDSLRSAFVQLFSEDCAAVYFEQNDFLDPKCLKFLISKGLSYGIIAGAFILKVPQIMKIVASGHTEGLSLLSFIMSSIGFLITFAYNMTRGYPFSTYGENAVIMVQDMLLIVLMLHYSGKMASVQRLGLVALYGGLVATLFSGSVPDNLFVYLQTATIPIFTAAKIPQILVNFKAASTGQLSAATTFLQFAGTTARVYTTVMEVDDMMVLTGFLISWVLNTVLFLQIVMYWGNSAGAKKKKSKKSD